MAQPRTLITGGAGFLGSHLCDRFIAEGHEVLCMDNLITGNPNNIAHLFERDDERFTFIKHDVTNYIHVGGELDYVLHFASPASPIDYLKLPIQTLKVGALGTHKALGLAKAKNARFLRIFNTYGARMRIDDGRALPTFMSQALRGEPLTVYGDGSQTRSFQYVDDLVEGIYRLLMSDEEEPVNIGNPDEITIKEFAEEIIDLTGSTSTITYEPLPKDDPQVRQPDISRAREILDWEPKVDRREGLSRTLDYFKKKIDVEAASET